MLNKVNFQKGAGKGFQHKGFNIGKGLMILGALIIIAAIYLLFFGNSSSPVFSSNKNVTLNNGSSYGFKLSGSGAQYVLYLASSGNSSAKVYFGKVPILANPIEVFTLSPSVSVNLSSTGTQTADIGVKFISADKNNARIALTPIPSALGVKASTGIVFLASGKNVTYQNVTTITSTTTTTIGTNTPTTTTGSTTVTTTIAATQWASINLTTYGSLMNNLNMLYVAAATGCTPTLYNTTFSSSQHTVPSGPTTFQNVSAQTPTKITGNYALVSGTVYYVTYTLVLPTQTSNVLTMKVDTSLGTVTSPSFGGIFAGQTYAALNSSYNTQNKIGNACAAYVP